MRIGLVIPLALLAACVSSPAVAHMPPTETLEQPVAPSVTTVAELAGPGGFGLLTVIPGTSGSTSSPEGLRASASAGARYARVNLDWSASEPEPGKLSFSTSNDRKIRLIEQAGLRVFPTLYVGRGWMNGSSLSNQQGGSRSYPPADLTSEWSDQSGYSPTYYQFVFQFFGHYRGHFDYVAIENEANSGLFWGGTSDEYIRLLKTAHLAIQAADPAVRVVDSGMVSSVWGLCIAQDDLQSGRRTREQVVQFAQDYYASPTGNIRIGSAADLDQTLGQGRVQEQCRRVTDILQNMGGAVEAVNFHFYEDYRVMPDVVDWIRYRTQLAGYTPAVLVNEMGQRGPDLAYAEGTDHAKEVFKKLVMARALGLEAVVWFSADTIGKQTPSPDKVGLFGEGGAERPAAQTFRTVSGILRPEYQSADVLDAGPKLFHYVFRDSKGVPNLEALWSEDGVHQMSLTPPQGYTHGTATDYLGHLRTLDLVAGTVQLAVDDAPVFVQWS
jgi:hypothetical protein